MHLKISGTLQHILVKCKTLWGKHICTHNTHMHADMHAYTQTDTHIASDTDVLHRLFLSINLHLVRALVPRPLKHNYAHV